MQAGTTRHELRLGSANVFSNRAGALRTLTEGLTRLVAQAGLPPDALADIPVFAGLAGVIDEVAAKEVAAALPLRRVEVADDRLPAVVGALGARTGCLIGVGTGSFLGRQDAQGIRLIGGHGWS
ncbi:MAG TPA: ATPase, partial [Ruegeria sp.]|nr:ATPase [Ruegeria sp.]